MNTEGSIESLLAALEVARINEQRAAVRAKAERGFQLRGVTENPFAGASSVHARVRERIKEIEEQIANAQADIEAVRFAEAYVQHIDVCRQLDARSAAAERLNQRIVELDPVLKRDERNKAIVDAHYQGHDRRVEVEQAIAAEQQAEEEERQCLIREVDEMCVSSAALASKRATLEHEFSDLKTLLELETAPNKAA